MVNLYLQKDRPFETNRFLGVVVTGTEEQRHTGILYRTEKDGEVSFLHLGFHYSLLRTTLKDDYCWLPLEGFDEDEQQSLAMWFHSIWENNGSRVPYGINFSTSRHFNSSGAFTASFDDGGLTCATFVLAIFQDFGFTLIDSSSSYRRDDDILFQDKIVSLLADHAPPEYVASQRDFIGIAARYRPEEVAGSASSFSEAALTFETAVGLGEDVLSGMRALGALR